MALKVVGAGVGRTGTHSLKLALEKLLDAPCYHMVEVFKNPQHVPVWHAASNKETIDWTGVFEGFSATVDWPSCAFWSDIAQQNPDSLILYSKRDPEKWWKSANDTIFRGLAQPSNPERQAWMDMIHAMFGETFTLDIQSKEACIAAFQRHEENVLNTAPRERLLVWEVSDGWEPLCKALHVPIPAEPFPKTNSTAEFQAAVFKARESAT